MTLQCRYKTIQEKPSLGLQPHYSFSHKKRNTGQYYDKEILLTEFKSYSNGSDHVSTF